MHFLFANTFVLSATNKPVCSLSGEGFPKQMSGARCMDEHVHQLFLGKCAMPTKTRMVLSADTELEATKACGAKL